MCPRSPLVFEFHGDPRLRPVVPMTIQESANWAALLWLRHHSFPLTQTQSGDLALQMATPLRTDVAVSAENRPRCQKLAVRPPLTDQESINQAKTTEKNDPFSISQWFKITRELGSRECWNIR